jgi:hypothetical protein
MEACHSFVPLHSPLPRSAIRPQLLPPTPARDLAPTGINGKVPVNPRSPAFPLCTPVAWVHDFWEDGRVVCAQGLARGPFIVNVTRRYHRCCSLWLCLRLSAGLDYLQYPHTEAFGVSVHHRNWALLRAPLSFSPAGYNCAGHGNSHGVEN